MKDFDVANAQTGTQVEVRVQGQQLRYGSLSGKHAEETVSDPVVVGPTLFGFIAAHWDSLVAGHPLAVRFVVTDSQTTYGFTLRHLETRATETEFVMEGAGLVSLGVKPQHFVFDSAKRRIIRYTGRVPPRRDTGGSLQDLDARVEYTHFAEYR